MIPASLFDVHPLHGSNHRTPEPYVEHTCPFCQRVTFAGPAKMVLQDYREHVYDMHVFKPSEGQAFEDCGCCGGIHHESFNGDCRSDWDRF